MGKAHPKTSRQLAPLGANNVTTQTSFETLNVSLFDPNESEDAIQEEG